MVDYPFTIVHPVYIVKCRMPQEPSYPILSNPILKFVGSYPCVPFAIVSWPPNLISSYLVINWEQGLPNWFKKPPWWTCCQCGPDCLGGQSHHILPTFDLLLKYSVQVGNANVNPNQHSWTCGCGSYIVKKPNVKKPMFQTPCKM